jgi:hypothetical protein
VCGVQRLGHVHARLPVCMCAGASSILLTPTETTRAYHLARGAHRCTHAHTCAASSPTAFPVACSTGISASHERHRPPSSVWIPEYLSTMPAGIPASSDCRSTRTGKAARRAPQRHIPRGGCRARRRRRRRSDHTVGAAVLLQMRLDQPKHLPAWYARRVTRAQALAGTRILVRGD